MLNTVTIGIQRLDGDIAVLATLNNNDEHMTPGEFQALVYRLASMLQSKVHPELCVEVFEREDVPDYVEV